MIRFDKNRTGYCAKHADLAGRRQRIAEYNKTVKSKPAHLKYKTENIPSVPKVCIVCDTPFLATPAAIKKGGGVVCGRRCNGIRAAKLTPKRETSIEKAIAKALDTRSILYEKQSPMLGVSLVDLYIPEYKVVIFCDGEYWHSFAKRKAQDAHQTKVLIEHGYSVYRFTEDEINRSPDDCVSKIIELRGVPFGQLRLPIDE